MIELHQHQAAYNQRGFTVMPLLEPHNADRMADTVMDAVETGKARFVTRYHQGEENTQIARQYHILDRQTLECLLPEIRSIYVSLPGVLAGITRRPVMTSPYERSAYCAKVYQHGGAQGAHYDTNSLTALVYLTTTDDGHTVIQALDDFADVHVQPVAGNLLVMDGHRCLHRADPVHGATPKIVLPLNYYFADAVVDRPADLDAVMFGDR